MTPPLACGEGAGGVGTPPLACGEASGGGRTPPLACGVSRRAPPSLEAMCACSSTHTLSLSVYMYAWFLRTCFLSLFHWYFFPSCTFRLLLVCSLGGVITNTVQDRGARCRSSVVPPLPDGDGGVTDRATRGACSAGSGIVRCTTSLGLRPSASIPSPSRVCVGSNHSGMGKPIVHCAFSHLRARWRGHVCHINRVAGRGVRGREGEGAGVAGAQPAQRSTEEQ